MGVLSSAATPTRRLRDHGVQARGGGGVFGGQVASVGDVTMHTTHESWRRAAWFSEVACIFFPFHISSLAPNLAGHASLRCAGTTEQLTLPYRIVVPAVGTGPKAGFGGRSGHSGSWMDRCAAWFPSKQGYACFVQTKEVPASILSRGENRRRLGELFSSSSPASATGAAALACS